MAILPSLFLVVVSTIAQTPGVDCSAFERTIDRALKNVASNSFPMEEGASANEVGVGNALLLISINLDLMRSHGCELPKEPIRGGEYVMAAVNCQIAAIKARTEAIRKRVEFGIGNIPTECDRGKWQRKIHDGDRSVEGAPTPPPQ